MGNERKPDMNNGPAECIPFHLLSQREQQVLQCAADGDSLDETGKILSISSRMVEVNRSNIGRIGIKRNHVANHNPNQSSLIHSALIQDGIVNGYITHELGEDPFVPLTPRETEVLGLVLQGMSGTEISQKLSISIKTFSSHTEHIHAKMHTRNTYHTIARAIYLKSHDMWPSTEYRGRK